VTEVSEIPFNEEVGEEHTIHEDYNVSTPSTASVGVLESESSEVEETDGGHQTQEGDEEVNDPTQLDSSFTFEDQEEKADRERIKREQEKKAKEREAQAGTSIPILLKPNYTH
jgi:hypothetical protein